MLRKCFVAAGLIGILLLIGCEKNILCDTAVVVSQETNTTPLTETVGIYMDVTTSMKGFLCEDKREGVTNYYSNCLMELKNMMASGFDSDHIFYYRVDTSVWATKENVLQEALKSGYYVSSSRRAERSEYDYNDVSKGTGYSFPCLTAALERGRMEDLSILITDLYENESENASVLIDKFGELASEDDGKVFGIFAVRSQFIGSIHDIGPHNRVDYFGLDEAEFRPFYIVARGYPDQVAKLCSNLEKRLNLPDGYWASYIFNTPSFKGLDDQNFDACKEYDKKLLWICKENKVETDILERYVYDYRGENSTLSKEIMFSYCVPDQYREEFSAFTSRFGDLVPVLDMGEEQLCHRLPVCVKDMEIARWSDNSKTFENVDDTTAAFIISSLSYDEERGVLYVGIQVEGFSQGIWRLRWKNVAAGEEDAYWWTEWGSYTGSEDYSKTERLGDYTGAILRSTAQEEFCFLNGSIYLHIER